MEGEKEEPTELKEVIEKEVIEKRRQKTLEEHVLSKNIVLAALIFVIIIAIGIVLMIPSESPSEETRGDTSEITAESPASFCGDGNCDEDEVCVECPSDCPCPTPEPYCGDGTCLGEENCSNCAQDCGDCPPEFGNDSEIGKPCESDSDCKLPMSYAILSSCPYQMRCTDGACEVFCPTDEAPKPAPADSDCLDCINVFELKYDAAGDDCINLNGEHITLRNRCEYDCDLTGWTVGNRNNKLYTFQEFVLGSKEKVTLYTGKGKDTEDKLYWNSRGWACNEIWKNDADTVFIKDSEGNPALVYPYW